MLTFDTSLQSWKNKLCSKTKCTVNVVLDFPHRYFQSCDSILPSLSPQRYIHRTVFTFQATRFCGAGCCWLPAAGAPPPSQLRTEAEAKREREGERTDGGRIVHLWVRETMTNRSKTETTKHIQQRVKDKDVIFIEDNVALWILHFSPIKVHLEFILKEISRRK